MTEQELEIERLKLEIEKKNVELAEKDFENKKLQVCAAVSAELANLSYNISKIQVQQRDNRSLFDCIIDSIV